MVAIRIFVGLFRDMENFPARYMLIRNLSVQEPRRKLDSNIDAFLLVHAAESAVEITSTGAILI